MCKNTGGTVDTTLTVSYSGMGVFAFQIAELDNSADKYCALIVSEWSGSTVTSSVKAGSVACSSFSGTISSLSFSESVAGLSRFSFGSLYSYTYSMSRTMGCQEHAYMCNFYLFCYLYMCGIRVHVSRLQMYYYVSSWIIVNVNTGSLCNIYENVYRF